MSAIVSKLPIVKQSPRGWPITTNAAFAPTKFWRKRTMKNHWRESRGHVRRASILTGAICFGGFHSTTTVGIPSNTSTNFSTSTVIVREF